MRMGLEARKALHVVIPSVDDEGNDFSATPSSKAKLASCLELDLVARVYLCHHLSGDILMSLFLDGRTARDLWLTLAKIYGTLDRVAILALKRKVYTHVHTNDTSIMSLMSTMDGYRMALAHAGARMGDDDLVEMVIESLLTNPSTILTNYRMLQPPVSVSTAQHGQHMMAVGTGDVVIRVPTTTTTPHMVMLRVCFMSLLSIPTWSPLAV